MFSGAITLGRHVHVAACVFSNVGDPGVLLDDFAGLASRVCIYAQPDDYGGEWLTCPTVPAEFGAASVLLPGVTVGDGSAVGAMSLPTRTVAPGGIYVGVPARRVRDRSDRILQIESKLDPGSRPP